MSAPLNKWNNSGWINLTIVCPFSSLMTINISMYIKREENTTYGVIYVQNMKRYTSRFFFLMYSTQLISIPNNNFSSLQLRSKSKKQKSLKRNGNFRLIASLFPAWVGARRRQKMWSCLSFWATLRSLVHFKGWMESSSVTARRFVRNLGFIEGLGFGFFSFSEFICYLVIMITENVI